MLLYNALQRGLDDNDTVTVCNLRRLVDSDKTLAAELPLINISTPHHKGAPTSGYRISASTEQSTSEPTQTANL